MQSVEPAERVQPEPAGPVEHKREAYHGWGLFKVVYLLEILVKRFTKELYLVLMMFSKYIVYLHYIMHIVKHLITSWSILLIYQYFSI